MKMTLNLGTFNACLPASNASGIESVVELKGI